MSAYRYSVIMFIVCFLENGLFGIGNAYASQVDSVESGYCVPNVTKAMVEGSRTFPELLRVARKYVNRQPEPIKYFHVEGILPHQGQRDLGKYAQLDFTIAMYEALAWRYTHDVRYLRQTISYLIRWAKVYEYNFNPIDEAPFVRYIIAYSNVKQDMTITERGIVNSFIKKMALGYVERVNRQQRPLSGNYLNNWESYRIQLITFAAFAIDDNFLQQKANEMFNAHIDRNINESGVTYDFQVRDSIQYAIADLRPLVSSALDARLYGHDWLTAIKPKQKLYKALRWIVPYAIGAKKHVEFRSTQIPFDRQRAAHGMRGFSGYWDPSRAEELFLIASLLDAHYAKLAKRLSSDQPLWFRACFFGNQTSR